jgi:hypothetical protein
VEGLCPAETASVSMVSRLLHKLTYKPGWTFDIDWEWSAATVPFGPYLRITWKAPDSDNPTRIISVQSVTSIPWALHSEEQAAHWLFSRIMAAEHHEAQEFFKIGGHAPYDVDRKEKLRAGA